MAKAIDLVHNFIGTPEEKAVYIKGLEDTLSGIATVRVNYSPEQDVFLVTPGWVVELRLVVYTGEISQLKQVLKDALQSFAGEVSVDILSTQRTAPKVEKNVEDML